jgi:hypothetical protein
MEENVTLNHGDPGSSPGLTTNPEIAPMVERELEELRVGGSNPPLGAKLAELIDDFASGIHEEDLLTIPSLGIDCTHGSDTQDL